MMIRIKLILFQLLLILGLAGIFPHVSIAQSSDTKPGYYLFPAAGRLAGIGAFYGLGFHLKNVLSSTVDITGGKSAGRIDAAGAGVSDINFFNDSVSFSAGFVQVNQLYLDTSYTRGMLDDDPVTQKGNAQGGAALLAWKFFEPRVRFSTALAFWNFRFDGYLTQGDETDILLPDLHLGDLNTTYFINSIVLDFTDDPDRPASGIEIGGSLSLFGTSTQFSSTSTLNYFFNGYLPLADETTLVLRGFGSDAAVTSQKMTDLAEIKSTLNVDCLQVADATKQAECQNLADGLAEYIAAHNQYGTATALGGSNMLRSYRELRFRGAHSRFLGAEIRWDFPQNGVLTNIQAAAFHEIGNAADELSELGEEYRASTGVALRFAADQLVARLEAAGGKEGQEWFLTFGKSW